MSASRRPIPYSECGHVGDGGPTRREVTEWPVQARLWVGRFQVGREVVAYEWCDDNLTAPPTVSDRHAASAQPGYPLVPP
jgi:hypothetical protein